jgi:D-hydroxyproline dehydrogenase subunit gamma
MFRKLREPGPGAVTVLVDGIPVLAEPGESVAAVLLRTPPFRARENPAGGGSRAPYCLMGVCFDCLAEVDGVPSTRSCTVSPREGMRIARQQGARVARG